MVRGGVGFQVDLASESLVAKITNPNGAFRKQKFLTRSMGAGVFNRN